MVFLGLFACGRGCRYRSLQPSFRQLVVLAHHRCHYRLSYPMSFHHWTRRIHGRGEKYSKLMMQSVILNH